MSDFYCQPPRAWKKMAKTEDIQGSAAETPSHQADFGLGAAKCLAHH